MLWGHGPADGSTIAAHRAARRIARRRRLIHRTTIEVRDLERMIGIGEIADVDATLIPPLHHDVAARPRNEPAVVRHTILLRGLRTRNLAVPRPRERLACTDVHHGVST